MKVLGVVAKTHDSGIALLEDGVPELIFEEERFNRVKKTKKFPKQSLAAARADFAPQHRRRRRHHDAVGCAPAAQDGLAPADAPISR